MNYSTNIRSIIQQVETLSNHEAVNEKVVYSENGEVHLCFTLLTNKSVNVLFSLNTFVGYVSANIDFHNYEFKEMKKCEDEDCFYYVIVIAERLYDNVETSPNNLDSLDFGLELELPSKELSFS